MIKINHVVSDGVVKILLTPSLTLRATKDARQRNTRTPGISQVELDTGVEC